jgi:hypothetical protein
VLDFAFERPPQPVSEMTVDNKPFHRDRYRRGSSYGTKSPVSSSAICSSEALSRVAITAIPAATHHPQSPSQLAAIGVEQTVVE